MDNRYTPKNTLEQQLYPFTVRNLTPEERATYEANKPTDHSLPSPAPRDSLEQRVTASERNP